MSVRNAEQFSLWLQGVLDERTRQCIESVRAMGVSDEAISEAMPTLLAAIEDARLEETAMYERIVAGAPGYLQ